MRDILKEILPWIKRLDLVGYKKFPELDVIIPRDAAKPLVRQSEDISDAVRDLEKELTRIGINPFSRNRKNYND